MMHKQNNSTLQILVAIIAIGSGTYGLLNICYEKGIWIYTEQQQVVFPFLIENKVMLLLTSFVLFLLINWALLLVNFTEEEEYDWEIFAINSFAYSVPFLLINFMLSIYSRPLGGIELFVALIISCIIGYFFIISSKLAVFRFKKLF
ncbi:hypothetical protein KO02_08480 [Sphingobacterium sp. ML3W]|uniref:hypothetical protein n=1 Tax=Sphingobacterium sp. ML3W TaxID=1538644 RepID=UPI0004F65335|nr:hypothetical protein [Sphingobacterium sp. ML3W]AIM36734.1 hypothetical protein KO02_08480 [Sphingobacterium sp. ML3W]